MIKNKCAYCDFSGTKTAMDEYYHTRRVTYKVTDIGLECSECEGMYRTMRIDDLIKTGLTLKQAKRAMEPVLYIDLVKSYK